MKKIAALSALTLLASAGAAFGQDFRIDYRILVQEITGSGAARVVTNAADNLFNTGDRVRFTVQYMVVDLRTAPVPAQAFVYGVTGTEFSIVGTGGQGTLSRSSLTTTGVPAVGGNTNNGEADTGNNSSNWPAGQQYPQGGTNAALSGLHQPWRFGTNGNDNSEVNGTIVGDDINNVVALNTNASNVNQLAGQWWGLYSFEYLANPGVNHTVSFSLLSEAPSHQFLLSGDDPESGGESTAVAVLHRRVGVPNPDGAPTFSFGTAPTVSLQFGVVGPVNQPPVAAEPNGDPVNVTANPMAPDAVNLVLASFSDPDAGDTVDVTIVSDGGLGLIGGTVTITGDNGATPTIVLNGDFNNAAIGQSFVVSYTATDGEAAPIAGTVTVNIVPAPGAAALLGLGGLLASRRRRA